MAADDEETTTVWFNPSCSKARGAKELLDERGVNATYVRYLDDTPPRAELERVAGLLGCLDDPRAMMRTGEAEYASLGLGAPSVGPSELFDAMVAHPVLIERPIVIRRDRAVIGRPPERVLDLL